MSKFRYFILSEFLKSDTAKQKGIDNVPDFEQVEHLMELTENFLEPLRVALGLPVFVESGFRCSKLNSAVGGSSTSAHPLGYAADITCPYMAFSKFVEFVKAWVVKAKVKFDQLIIETNPSTGNQWLHVGYKDRLGRQRGQVFKMTKE